MGRNDTGMLEMRQLVRAGRKTGQGKIAEWGEGRMQMGTEREMSGALEAALTPAVLLHTFPKMCVDVYCLVVEADGGVLPVAISTACLALAHAGIALRDLVPSCTLVLPPPSFSPSFSSPSSSIPLLFHPLPVPYQCLPPLSLPALSLQPSPALPLFHVRRSQAGRMEVYGDPGQT